MDVDPPVAADRLPDPEGAIYIPTELTRFEITPETPHSSLCAVNATGHRGPCTCAPVSAAVSPAEPPESRLVEIEAHKVLLVPPVEAAKYDPPMSEWFALPEYRGNGCPECGGERWGTVNPIGYLPIRKCHSGCSARWRTPITPHDIYRIVGALTGEEIRLGRS